MASLRKIAVVSSVYGSYDPIKTAVPQTVEADWIFITDRNVASYPWTVIVEPRPPKTEPRLASRVPKCDPWLYTDADVVIWIDGNIEVTSPHFIEWCLDSLGDDVICQNRQYWAENVFDEMKASFNVGGLYRTSLEEQAAYLSGDRDKPFSDLEWKAKWGDDPIVEQIDTYMAQGYPPDYGIWWCGLMVRTKDCPDFGGKWMTEMVRWTCQDQLAHSFLMHKLGIKPASLDMTSTDLPKLYRYLPKNSNELKMFEFVYAIKSEHFTRYLHPDNTK